MTIVCLIVSPEGPEGPGESAQLTMTKVSIALLIVDCVKPAILECHKPNEFRLFSGPQLAGGSTGGPLQIEPALKSG